MGRCLCRHLMDAGHPTTVMNRTPSKAQELIDAGAVWADSPREVARNSDVVFVMVGFPSDVEEVILGADGVLAGCEAGKIMVDMTTSRPELAVHIAKAASKKRVGAIDAPVSGGDIGAAAGTLSIMVGGQAEQVSTVMPLLEILGKTVVLQGGPGTGQHTKMVNQTLIASGMVAVCEALLYATKAGLDLSTVLKSVSSGAAGSWSLSNLAPRMIEGDFQPGFYIEHFIKDMGIALEEAERMNLSLPGLALAHQLYQAVAAQGYARNGTQALVFALAELSQMPWPDRCVR